MSSAASKKSSTIANIRLAATIVLGLVGIFWVLEIVDQLILNEWLDQFGIRPRSPDGLFGIIAAPFLHGDFRHLMSNTLPFIILGGLLALRSIPLFFSASIVIAVIAGLSTWLVGAAESVHIGASSVIFGYLGFHLAAAWYERSFRAGLIALGVGLFYGGMIWGVLPNQPGVSWEGHLFGFIGGVVAARLLSQRKES